jgi:hypothetical protein
LRWLATEAAEPELVVAFGGRSAALRTAPERGRPQGARERRNPAPRIQEVRLPNQSQQTNQASSRRPDIHLDINIHIDANASREVIDEIFASMARHLYSERI